MSAPLRPAQEQPAPLEELLRGSVARSVLLALIRDMTREKRVNGAPVPDWALDVCRALQDASGEEFPASLMAGMGHQKNTLVAGHWLDVAEASRTTGLSPRHVRRLASTGAVIAHRIGRRTWTVESNSLANVLQNRKTA